MRNRTWSVEGNVDRAEKWGPARQVQEDYAELSEQLAHEIHGRASAALEAARAEAQAVVEERVAAAEAAFDEQRGALEEQLEDAEAQRKLELRAARKAAAEPRAREDQWVSRAQEATRRLELANELAREQAKLAKLADGAREATSAERASLNTLLPSGVKTLRDAIHASEASLLGQRLLIADEPLPDEPVPHNRAR